MCQIDAGPLGELGDRHRLVGSVAVEAHVAGVAILRVHLTSAGERAIHAEELGERGDDLLGCG